MNGQAVTMGILGKLAERRGWSITKAPKQGRRDGLPKHDVHDGIGYLGAFTMRGLQHLLLNDPKRDSESIP